MGVSRLPARFDRPGVLRGLAVASIVANVVIVITGGAVRLTSSGLGCPTWPTCTGTSLTPTRAASFHGIIENTNRQLTFVLTVIAVLTLVAAVRQRRQVRLAALAFGIIPAQAVIGGISVLTHLNPWVVCLHFLASMAIIAVTVLLWWRVRLSVPRAAAPPSAVLLARVVLGVTSAVLVVGTVVTGSGPHAGDKGATHRIQIQPRDITQVHADLVMVLIGLTVGLLVLARAVGVPSGVRRAVAVLFAVELAQGVIGYVQYFTHVPSGLVIVHMLGACLVWVAALRVLLELEEPADAVDHDTDQGAHDRAVHPDELQVTPDL